MNKIYISSNSNRGCIVLNELKSNKPYRIDPYPDKTNKDIPLGNTMLDELKKMFLQINTYTKLSYACTKINK